jgi:hypothetical protein
MKEAEEQKKVPYTHFEAVIHLFFLPSSSLDFFNE